MNLAQFTEPKLLIPRLLSTRREGALIELSKKLEAAGRIENAGLFVDAVLEHEALASAPFDGVAFAQARGRAVKKLSFALGLAPQPICWGLASSAPGVHTVVLFAVPLSEAQRFLSLVLAFSTFLKDEMAFSALRRCVQPEGMLSVLGHVRVARTTHQTHAGQFARLET